jgi:hypothetical protein
MLMIISFGPLQVSVALILIEIEGSFGMSWLVCLVGGICLGTSGASRSPVLEDFVKSSSEGRKSLTVKGGCNTARRFLGVVACVDDDRKGIIWIPEAHS